MENKILIIEDDSDIVDLIEIHLNDLGYKADSVLDGEKGLDKALNGEYDLIILDIMLPKMNGLEVCKRIREHNKVIPLLMLTSKSEELDKILGLELGANDYISKPFSIRELIARVKANLRSVEAVKEEITSTEGATELHISELTINFEKRKVTISGQQVTLTAKEFDLLAYFARHAGRSFTRQELLNSVWGYQFDGYDHTVNSHINRLRTKIEKDPTHPKYIETVWGVGYRFTESEDME